MNIARRSKIAILTSILLLLSVEAVLASTDAPPGVRLEQTSSGSGSRALLELPNDADIKRQFEDKGVHLPGSQSPAATPYDVKLREPVITLKGAVEEASSQNQEIKKNRFEVERFKWDYAASQASRLPNLRVLSYLAQQTVSDNLAVPKQADAFVFLSALFPVTQQYRMGLMARAVRLGEEIAQHKLEQEVNDTRAKVKGAYYKLVLDQSKLATLEVAIKYLKELEVTTANRVKEGNSLKVEVMQVQAKLDKLELEQTVARNALQIDKERFNHLLGRKLDSGVVLEAIPPPDDSETDIAGAEQKALSRRPEILAVNARRRQINLEKKATLAEYIPNVSIGAVYVGLPGFNNVVLPKNVFAPGMFISYNAFDWGRRAFIAKAQSKNEHAAAMDLASVKEEVLIDLHAQINKVSETRQAVKTTQFARDVALENLRVSMNRFKHTSDKLAEVLAAQSTLAETNNTYHEALLAFWEAKAQFDRAIGQ